MESLDRSDLGSLSSLRRVEAVGQPAQRPMRPRHQPPNRAPQPTEEPAPAASPAPKRRSPLQPPRRRRLAEAVAAPRPASASW
jgi:hypothetical protein